jgi:hypothetical protein
MSLGTPINGNIGQAIVGSGIYSGSAQVLLVFNGQLITGNTFDLDIDGTGITQVPFSISNNQTLENIVAELNSNALVLQAKQLTGNQNANDYGQYRILITFEQLGGYIPVVSNAVVGGGASQITVTIQPYDSPNQILCLVTNPIDILKATRVDVTGVGGITYRGYALVGSLDANPVWAIQRETVTGGVTVVEWAGGEFANSYVWDDRASITTYA